MDVTTRQSYRKPLQSEQYDVAHQNFNWDKADLINGVTLCTSTTRPGTPSVGMLIFESDTNQLRTWQTGSWMLASPEQFLNLGGKRYTTAGTLATITTAEALAGMDTGSNVLEANKTYEIDFLVEVAVSVATTNALLRVRDTNLAGAVISTIRLPNQPVTAKYQYQFSVPVVGAAAGARTYVLTAQRDVGTPSITITATAGTVPYMKIKKIGANTLLTAV